MICPNYGGKDFDVGDALFLGFLFHSEDSDAYVVGLTCLNPSCPREDRRYQDARTGAPRPLTQRVRWSKPALRPRAVPADPRAPGAAGGVPV